MKKIFTSISMALCLAASSFNASAQQATQLSDAQKQEIQQKVLPVVFEQIKEQAGIDILGWAQPKLTADYLGSLPGFSGLKSSNGLRAATDINVQPDSILIDQTAIVMLSPEIGALMGDMKIIFGEECLNLSLPLGEQTVTINMPKEITVTTTSVIPTFQNLAKITIESRETEGLMFDMGIDISLYGEEDNVLSLLDLAAGWNAESKLDVNIALGDFFEGLVSPRNYVISADVLSALATGVVSASLKAIL